MQGGLGASVRFFAVPWSGRCFGLEEMAALEQQLERVMAEMTMTMMMTTMNGSRAGSRGNPYGDPGDPGALAMSGTSGTSSWEFQKILESEKSRLRGVLEALGPAGWYGFVARTQSV